MTGSIDRRSNDAETAIERNDNEAKKQATTQGGGG